MSGDTTPVTLRIPPDGCWMARSCVLRLDVAPPLRPGEAPPVVREASSMEVLDIRPGAVAGSWQVRVLAYEAGPVALPVLAVDTIDHSGQHRFVDTTAGTLAISRRDWPAGTALAGMERLAPAVNPLWWICVVSASVLLGAAALLCSMHARRAARWLERLIEPGRVRLAARRLLRRAAHHGDARQVYHRIIAALRLVLAYREGRPLAALTAPELARLADRLDLPVVDRDRLCALLTRSDAVRFGRQVPPMIEIATDLSAARDLVTSRRVVTRPRSGR